MSSQPICPPAPKKEKVTRAHQHQLTPRRITFVTSSFTAKAAVAPGAPRKSRIAAPRRAVLVPRELKFLTFIQVLDQKLKQDRQEAQERARVERAQRTGAIVGKVLFF